MSSAREVEPPVGKLHRLRVDHGDVADPHELARLLAVARADVDVQVADLGDLLALLVAQQVDRLLADDARDRPLARVEHDALADEDLRVPAADFAKPQVAVVVDVGDDQPDLVDVAHHEQPSGARSRKPCLGATSASGVPTTSVLTLANPPAASRHTPRGALS